jgi:hypothetical protein
MAVPVSEDVEPAMNGPRGYQLKVANVGFGEESPPTASGRSATVPDRPIPAIGVRTDEWPGRTDGRGRCLCSKRA